MRSPPQTQENLTDPQNRGAASLLRAENQELGSQEPGYSGCVSPYYFSLSLSLSLKTGFSQSTCSRWGPPSSSPLGISCTSPSEHPFPCLPETGPDFLVCPFFVWVESIPSPRAEPYDPGPRLSLCSMATATDPWVGMWSKPGTSLITEL